MTLSQDVSRTMHISLESNTATFHHYDPKTEQQRMSPSFAMTEAHWDRVNHLMHDVRFKSIMLAGGTVAAFLAIYRRDEWEIIKVARRIQEAEHGSE